MTVKDQVLLLPKDEKLMIMEALWDSLTQDADSYESPDWHEGILKETRERYIGGGEKIFELDEAKKRFRK